MDAHSRRYLCIPGGTVGSPGSALGMPNPTQKGISWIPVSIIPFSSSKKDDLIRDEFQLLKQS